MGDDDNDNDLGGVEAFVGTALLASSAIAAGVQAVCDADVNGGGNGVAFSDIFVVIVVVVVIVIAAPSVVASPAFLPCTVSPNVFPTSPADADSCDTLFSWSREIADSRASLEYIGPVCLFPDIRGTPGAAALLPASVPEPLPVAFPAPVPTPVPVVTASFFAVFSPCWAVGSDDEEETVIAAETVGGVLGRWLVWAPFDIQRSV